MSDFETTDDLPRKLGAWRVEPSIPSGFQREVWTKIAAREAARADSSWTLLTARVLAQFATPRYATALILVALSISMTAAHVRSRTMNSRHWTMLEARYTQSVDPFSHHHP